MKPPPPDRLASALAESTRTGVLAALTPRPRLTLPEINRLAAHLANLPEPLTPVKIAVLREYTTELLQPHWTCEARLQGLEPSLYQGAYGTILQEIQPGSPLLHFAPDITYLFLHPDARSPDDLPALLQACRDALPGLIVATLLPPFHPPPLGLHDAMAESSAAARLADGKRTLATTLRTRLPSVLFCDLDAVLADLGRAAAFDLRLWYASRFPFSVAGAQTVATSLVSYAAALKRPRVKCVVLDADNTLWGGIVGEDGPDGIALGPDYPGAAFVDFQRRLLALQQRGLLLALCSKNNEADVLEVLHRHPHQVLREEHFAALRVNWTDKPANLRDIASDLNLGLDALLFIDDSSFECHAVRAELPQVITLQAPAQPLALPGLLDHLPQLEILGLTDEDRRRASLYAARRRHVQSTADAASLPEYLASLQMVMRVGFNDRAQIPRIAQLTQKTNQFNLTTRRHTDADIARRMADPDALVAHFRLADRHDDHGLVGVAIVRGIASGTAEIDTFLMSCRVIGREAETAFAHELFSSLARRGVTRIRAAYLPTAKNTMVAGFWPRLGLAPAGDGLFETPLPVPLPETHIQVLSDPPPDPAVCG